MTKLPKNRDYYYAFLAGWLNSGMKMLAQDSKFLALTTDKERLAYVQVKLDEADAAATKNALAALKSKK